ncbi:hypothetical protein DEF24_25895 [Marinitenerispora sediminis]|uniref:Uncharacterized protein n=1 Tax=Marinitenerispora sediminis TaxID=1931232 RepID=A0A368SYE7_9ACTN|nr:hypothetical protein DEF24_25895 [Marinitenerispora sediminis]
MAVSPDSVAMLVVAPDWRELPRPRSRSCLYSNIGSSIRNRLPKTCSTAPKPIPGLKTSLRMNLRSVDFAELVLSLTSSFAGASGIRVRSVGTDHILAMRGRPRLSTRSR